MLAFSGILLICMVIQHPRFLARLFASLPSRRKRERLNAATALKAATGRLGHLEEKPETQVGGGGLGTGWLLRNGKPVSDTTFMEKDDPFSSPFDNAYSYSSSPYPTTTTIPTTPRIKLAPPPHMTPLLSHLPFTSLLLWAPFARFPRPFSSTIKLPYLYIIIAYLTLIGLALVWKSDITPSTKAKGYGNDFQRTGLVGVSQIPLVIALGVRGNIIGLCVGKGYERLKVLHKVTGRVTLLAVSFHVAFWRKFRRTA